MLYRRKAAALVVGGLLCTSSLAMAAPKVLLVGIDGVQYQKLLATSPSQLARLHHTATFTGGVKGTGLEQATVSGPGWSTILTGVWANKHRVYSNDSDLADPRFPSLFKRIRDARPDAYIASITNWASINQRYFRNEVGSNNLNLSGLNDEAVTQKVVETLKTTPADFVFVHLDDPDHAGHSSCFGSAYDRALRDSDRRLGQMLDVVTARQAQGDDWLVLVTTDHGRDAAGCGHGAQTPNEKTSFIASNKPLNAEFNQYVDTLENRDFDGIYGRPAQTSIAPTILRHLGITLQPDWLLDGTPLLGTTGVRKLMPARNANADFTWFANTGSPVLIRRNGTLLASVPASQMSWRDPAGLSGLADYSLEMDGTPIALRLNRREVSATLDWDIGRSYVFLNGGEYVRYNQILDRADTGYPRAVDQSNWPGLAPYTDQIVAGFSKDANIAYLFLSDGRYIRYNKSADRADAGYPQPVNDANWPGLGAYGTQIRATLRWKGDKVYFFLRDGRYIRYDLKNDRIDPGYPAAVNDANWKGLGAYGRDIVAAVKWNDSRAYFFLTDRRYIRYDIANDRAEAGYPKAVNHNTWPGMGVE
ncbi:alkaline phosphatase family protein [Parachitinimonas caeni]|uniref:Alkaline phosphatase family protein n=1 Tax=Parachitinimonas caeni TaxID=3031301 RepID=A0ABT7E1G2_9NEIS|nr:alkaline phosphatase family protein [Parachitinimonas caeni]MDK2126153.1 alkaline phosphatase family protein [Parachitinimonas caeni]